MKISSTGLALISALALAPLANANDGYDLPNAADVSLGTPAYGGNGCPAGTASATLSPDTKSLSILFDGFSTEAGGTTQKRLDRKSCNISIPVHVPQGFSVSIFHVDYRGFNALPAGGRSTFNVEYFFAGGQGPRQSRDFYGPINEDYLISHDLMAQAVVWSPCGRDVNLRANTSLMTLTNGRREEAMSTVDSADINTSILYQLQWRRCNRPCSI